MASNKRFVQVLQFIALCARKLPKQGKAKRKQDKRRPACLCMCECDYDDCECEALCVGACSLFALD